MNKEKRNAAAVKLTLEHYEERIQTLEGQMNTVTNHLQTVMAQMQNLQTSNNLALQALRGHGATHGDNG